jgi:RNA polymerase sigma factor (sigma-70 family)
MGVAPFGIESRSEGFKTTHWTVIRACARGDERAHAALCELCNDYWQPVYGHVCRQGYAHHDAQDLVQDFFTGVVAHGWFARVDQSRGRFRSFLLASLQNFLRDRFDRRMAKKRGGGCAFISLEAVSPEGQSCPLALRDPVDPEAAYELKWAAALLAAALRRLEDEFAAQCKAHVFERIKICLTADADGPSYEGMASSLGVSRETLRVAVHRLRKRYGAIVREEVARTVAAPEEVEDEMRHLRSVLTAH